MCDFDVSTEWVELAGLHSIAIDRMCVMHIILETNLSITIRLRYGYPKILLPGG